MAAGRLFDTIAGGLSDGAAVTRRIYRKRAGNAETRHKQQLGGMPGVTDGPGATITFRNPDVTVQETQLLLDGPAIVTMLDMDGRPVRRYRTQTRMLVSVTAGTAAAADVDGVRAATVRVTFGQVDSVFVVYTCGVTANVLNYPMSETVTSSGSNRWRPGRGKSDSHSKKRTPQ